MWTVQLRFGWVCCLPQARYSQPWLWLPCRFSSLCSTACPLVSVTQWLIKTLARKLVLSLMQQRRMCSGSLSSTRYVQPARWCVQSRSLSNRFMHVVLVGTTDICAWCRFLCMQAAVQVLWQSHGLSLLPCPHTLYDLLAWCPALVVPACAMQTGRLEPQPGRTLMEAFEGKVNSVLNKARDDAGE